MRFEWNIPTWTGCFALTFGSDIYVPLRTRCNNICDPQTSALNLHSAVPIGALWLFPSCHKPVLTQYKLGFCWTVKRMHIKSPHQPVFISICPLRVSACPYCQAAIISCLADTEWRFWRVGPEEAALRATEPLTSKGVGFRSDQQLDVPPA